jgi:uncharacterized membrane protein YdbT with pleckstrin-like domain
MITCDRRCMQRNLDIVEGKHIIDEETKQNTVRQIKRLIQVDKDVESGDLCGRPRKKR